MESVPGTLENRYSLSLNGALEVRRLLKRKLRVILIMPRLTQAYEKANLGDEGASRAARAQLDDASARLLAVQSVFTDRRAYVNALTYEFETSGSASAKASKQKEIDTYKAGLATVEFPDGSRKKFNFPQLEETYNGIRDEKTKLSLQLGEVLKPVTAARAKMDGYVSDHMVDLTPTNRWTEKEDNGLGSGRSCKSTWPRRILSTGANPATWVRASR